MDDLFSLPGNDRARRQSAAIKPMRHRARTANSFRAVWEPVACCPSSVEVPDVAAHRRRRDAVAPRAPTSIYRSRAATRASPCSMRRVRRRSIDFGEIAQPDRRRRDSPSARGVRACHRAGSGCFTRGLEIMPFALAALLISTLVWGAFFLPIPLVVMLLGFDIYWAWRSLNMGIHTDPRLPRDEGDGAHRLAAAATTRRRCRTGRSPRTTAVTRATSSPGTTSTTW